MKKIRVLIIDDSVMVRKLLTEMLNSSPDIEVIGAAADPLKARDMIKQLNPDVLTLDIEMPKMDGITFLKNLMRLRPTPVVMISTLTEKGAEVTLEALKLGAVDFIAKPKVDLINTLNQYTDEIVAKVKIAAQANVNNIAMRHLNPQAGNVEKPGGGTLKEKLGAGKQSLGLTRKIIAIGASTGGTEAIKVVAKSLSADLPPVVITQHLPAAFSESFVRHIDMVAPMAACIPKDGQIAEPGHIYLAPGDRHMLIKKEASGYVIKLDNSEPVNRHKPAVDVMFRSLIQSAGANTVAVLLTGMGADGAQGMKELHGAGAKTIIQDEQSSVVWGMPGAAYKLGCTDYMLPLNDIAQKILGLIK
jgi:two-component system chemotaxis response regulator CheB